MDNYLRSFYTIRFSDCDPFAHLNNARYIDYFLNAREDHLKTYYDLDLAVFYKKNIGWVIQQHEIVYLKPANLNEKVCIQTALLDAGAEQLLVEAIMFDENIKQIKALMHTRLVPVNLKTGRKEAHDENFMKFLIDKVVLTAKDHPVSLKGRVEFWK